MAGVLGGLPVLEKFINLKEALSGEAASIIEELPLTAANYVAAVELLTQHYGSTKVIIQENFRYLHNMPVVPPGDFTTLKQFLINSEVRIRSLESLGVPRESYATPFFFLFWWTGCQKIFVRRGIVSYQTKRRLWK